MAVAMAAVLPQESRSVRVADLREHPKNPRRGDVDAVADSVKRNGFYGAVVVQKSTMRVLAGNHRLRAARKLGMAEVPCVVVDVDDDAALRILLVDNRASDIATTDDLALISALRSLPDIDGTGYSDADLARLLMAAVGKPTDDTPPAARGDVVSEVGHAYRLGPHVIVCGDATDAASWDAIGLPRDSSMCLTSPPYLCNAQLRQPLGRGASSLYVSDEDDGAWPSMVTSAVDLASKHCTSVAVNVQPLARNKVALWRLMGAWADRIADVAVWDKGRAAPALAERVFSSAFELVVVLGDVGANRAMPLANFDRGSEQNVLRLDPGTNDFADVHRAVFPLDFARWAIRVVGGASTHVVDCFAGTGTSIIAAAEAGKIGAGIELEPSYVDVIRRRLTTWMRARGIDVGDGALAE